MNPTTKPIEDPLAIEVRCSCGRIYHADPAHAGRSIRCRCGKAVPIPTDKSRSNPRVRRFPIPQLNVSYRTRRIFTVACWSYVLLVAAVALVMWTLGDVWWPASILLFGPRWVLILPALPLLLGALAIRPRLAGPVIVAGLIALGPVTGFRTGWHRWFAGNAPRQLRIITFNTEGGYNRNVAEIPIALLRYQPDVLAFQECPFDPTRPEIWPAGWTFRLSDGDVCLATRFPIREELTLERIRTGDQGGTGNAALFRLDTGSRIVDVVVVHLETPRKGLESLRYEGRFSRMAPNLIVREIGATRVRRWIDRQSSDAIVAGDFNMPVESRIYRKIFGDCTNAHSTAGLGFGWTRVLRWFSVRIDQVIACGAWTPLHAEVGPDLGSDHLPLIVDLRHP